MEDFDPRRRQDEERQRARQEDQGRREDQRFGQQRSEERSRFSPDWSREGSQPRYSDEPYYSRNREPTGTEEGSHYRGSYSRSATPFSYPGGSGYVYSESVTLHGPYTGRGPKGYKRSDEQIVEEACQRLERDGEIDASEIEVSAEEGVIRLRGTVQDRNIKRRAEQCVESIYGARDVMNELRVSQQSNSQSQGGQRTQASQSGQGSQTSQSSQASGSLASTPGMRPAGAPASEQPGEDKRTPRH